MSTVAFIGGDGSGKSTITNLLLEHYPNQTKYLYMGMSARSNKKALPTTRLMHLLKTTVYKRTKKNQDQSEKELMRLYYEENRGFDKRGKLGAIARLVNRWLEEWYRQILSWYYQIRGFLVIYDRHFFFDYAPINGALKDPKADRMTEKIHRWTLKHLYPKPSLTLFLDAPSEVLMSRKGEATIEYLDTKRNAYLDQGRKIANFIQIDATQPLDNVYNEVKKQTALLIN